MQVYIEKIITFFKRKYPDIPLIIIKGSEDPEIDQHLASEQAEASAIVDIDGTAIVMIRDKVAGRAAIYEEFSHILQFVRDGHVSSGIAYLDREVEVSECLLKRQRGLHLKPDEIRQTELNLAAYRQRLEANTP